MSLSKHINAEEVIEKAKEHPLVKHAQSSRRYGPTLMSSDTHGGDGAELPKYTIPKTGIDRRDAYQLLHDEMNLDGNPALNLASFVTTWMPEEADKLFVENINKNLADVGQYPAAIKIHNRCISMLADLWKAPKNSTVIGTAAGGSSEAILLGGLAMKRRWQKARQAAKKDWSKPNIVFGTNSQVALEKFANYFDVELKAVEVKAANGFVMDPNDAIKKVDENTIGVIVIVGSTYTGHFENVQLMSDLLDKYEQDHKINIPIHVDAASAAFVAPFVYPNLKWAFDIKRVVSINASGHKFGLVYAGLGWVLWRDQQFLDESLIFKIHYLGGTDSTFTLNFSKPAAPVVSQMFNFLNLGFEGFKNIATKDLRNARMLSRALDNTYFTVLSDIHKPLGSVRNDSDDPTLYRAGLPVVAFRLSDEFKKANPKVQQSSIAVLLRTKGWIVPNYNAPKGEENVEMLRVVVRASLTEDMVERFIVDILEITESLKDSGGQLVSTTSKLVINHPEQSYSQPDPANFGDANQSGGKKQIGFSGQC